MAQVELSTGAVLWSNHAFRKLADEVGRGVRQTGLQTLVERFLQDVPRALHCQTASVQVKDDKSYDLWSATEVTGPPGSELVLWVIRQPLHLLPSSSPLLIVSTLDEIEEETDQEEGEEAARNPNTDPTKSDSEEADLMVSYLTFAQTSMSSQEADAQDVNRLPYGHWRPFGNTLPDSRLRTEGTLILDLVDPKTRKLVWRGQVKDVRKNPDDPGKLRKNR